MMCKTTSRALLAPYLLIVLILIVFNTLPNLAQVVAPSAPSAWKPKTPIFANNYHVQGVLSLPYAELNEPFNAWYDKNNSRSRTDYYGDLYQIYQFGPQQAPEEKHQEFGAMYKMVYVPANFHPQNTKPHDPKLAATSGVGGGVLAKFHHAYTSISERVHLVSPGLARESATKRACFSVPGAVGNTIQPQTVLPNLVDFEYHSSGPCPPLSDDEHQGKKCELWKLVTNVEDKKNTYKFWIRRAGGDSPYSIPVHFYMLGYDTLLGSHFDRYDITYRDFKPNSAKDQDFAFRADQYNCGSMPGPGNDSGAAQRRAHMVIQNPIHEYVVDMHDYSHVDHEFEQFKDKHGKHYPNPRGHRKNWFNFMHNSRFINSKNRHLKEYKLGVNKFADNSPSELGHLRGRLHSEGYNGGLDYAKHHKYKGSNGLSPNEADQVPETWDWSLRGAVTPVKDQAVCGSCWSFGTSGTIEGAYFVKTGKLPVLSQQQMVDCSWQYGNNGCDGGEDFRAYKYIMDAGGLATSEDYGNYLAVDGKCLDANIQKAVKISGFYNVTTNNVEALKHAIITHGPVTVAIDASRPTFTFYSHGVYYDDKCSNATDGLDHQVLVTGYTVLDGKFVWIVKNSWSTYWGNNGYIMMSAENNNCGVMDTPTVPIIQI